MDNETQYGVFLRHESNGNIMMIVAYRNQKYADEMCEHLRKDNEGSQRYFFVCPIVDSGK